MSACCCARAVRVPVDLAIDLHGPFVHLDESGDLERVVVHLDGVAHDVTDHLADHPAVVEAIAAGRRQQEEHDE